MNPLACQGDGESAAALQLLHWGLRRRLLRLLRLVPPVLGRRRQLRRPQRRSWPGFRYVDTKLDLAEGDPHRLERRLVLLGQRRRRRLRRLRLRRLQLRRLRLRLRLRLLLLLQQLRRRRWRLRRQWWLRPPWLRPQQL